MTRRLMFFWTGEKNQGGKEVENIDVHSRLKKKKKLPKNIFISQSLKAINITLYGKDVK